VTRRWLLVATALLWWRAPGVRGSGPARAAADSCTAPGVAGPESLVAAGRFWHALRVAPGPSAERGPQQLRVAVLRLEIEEGLGRRADAEAVLTRVRGADTVPELLVLAARQAERNGRWQTALARERRLAALAGARPVERAAAVVGMAVAFERLHEADSALAAWRRVEQTVPDLADWFAVRRVELDPDTTTAFASVADARSPGVADVADSLVALRRVAAGNLRGALAIYLRRGRMLDAARVETMLGRPDVARLRVNALLTADPARPAALLAATFLLEQRTSPSAMELLDIARVYRTRGDLRSADRFYRRALAAHDTSVSTWLDLAQVAAARHRVVAARAALADARRQIERRSVAPTLLAKANVLVLGAQGRWTEGDSLVTRLARTAPGDTTVAAAALAMADHERWQGTTEAERRWYDLLVERFDATPAATIARFRLALAAYAAGRPDQAAAGLAEVVARDTARRLGPSPRYWVARLGLERHDATAAAALRAFAAEDPSGYYGVRARELLGDSLPLGPDSALPPPAGFSPTRAADRVTLLAAIGLAAEARAEALGWSRDTSASPQLLTAAAAAATRAGFAQEAIFLGLAARARAGITRGVAEALFPLPYRAALVAEAEEHCVDPMLLAAIVRQESRFQLRALSRAGARGLSQLLPRTARQMSRRYGPWDAALLYVADFNLHFGARYLRDRLVRDSLPLYAVVASYDAGPVHFTRWRQWPEMRDADLFIERLPIAETRDYLRSVYANYQWYRHVYGRPGAGPA
jgi:soluble lytic murein transglycosylase